MRRTILPFVLIAVLAACGKMNQQAQNGDAYELTPDKSLTSSGVGDASHLPKENIKLATTKAGSRAAVSVGSSYGGYYSGFLRIAQWVFQYPNETLVGWITFGNRMANQYFYPNDYNSYYQQNCMRFVITMTEQSGNYLQRVLLSDRSASWVRNAYNSLTLTQDVYDGNTGVMVFAIAQSASAQKNVKIDAQTQACPSYQYGYAQQGYTYDPNTGSYYYPGQYPNQITGSNTQTLTTEVNTPGQISYSSLQVGSGFLDERFLSNYPGYYYQYAQ